MVSVRGAYNHIMEVPKLDAAENRRQRAWVEKTTVSMVSYARKASSAVRSNVIEIERTWRSEDLKIRDSNEQNMPVQVLLYISCSVLKQTPRHGKSSKQMPSRKRDQVVEAVHRFISCKFK